MKTQIDRLGSKIILLADEELEAVAGGRPDISDIVVVKVLDSTTLQLYPSAPAK
jgi:hypothetical protein